MGFGLDGVTITVDDVYLVTSKIVLDVVQHVKEAWRYRWTTGLPIENTARPFGAHVISNSPD